MINFSLMPLTCMGPGMKQEDLYQNAKNNGITHIDPSTFDERMSGGKTMEMLQQNGLKCGSYLGFVHAPRMDGAGVAEAVEEGKRCVDRTVELGSTLLMYVPGSYQADIAGHGRQEIADALAACLRPVVAYAAEKGVTVMLEDSPDPDLPMTRMAELKYLMEQVPGAKIVYDSGNTIVWGEDPVEWYEALKEYVVHIHLKDVQYMPDDAPRTDRCGDGRRFTNALHGHGVVDLKAVMKAIKASGYDGLMTIEGVRPLPGMTPAEALYESKTYLDKCWEEA